MLLLPVSYKAGVVELWLRASRYDAGLTGHSWRVSCLVESFAASLRVSKREQYVLARAALLHDVGKLEIAPDILHKGSVLNMEERAYVRSHAEKGHRLLIQAGETDHIALSVARDHHERLDGTGYPRGLSAMEIDWPVRLISICDVYSAMTETRSYADPMSCDAALERMLEGRLGLDAELTRRFATLIDKKR